MSAARWDDGDDASWEMHASAEDEGRIYQAGRDQHITEYHFHGSASDVDDEDADDDWYYQEVGGSSWDEVWASVLSVLMALAPLLPFAIVGASIHSVWTADSARSFWSVLYSLGAVIVGATAFTFLRERLSYRSDLIDTLSWLYWPMNISVLVYYVMGDPAKLNINFIGDIGLQLAQKLGPL
ncbi:hypothetical protein [Streptomyces sp. VMFN-G11Ma]|jgi:hypothetical protein|uniref:hypothetical protein n=1 Tax=Streptomyces sp. VMFN-G11Ma TaxID=2135609 RepID=UPI000D4CEBCB|nr:hypothetical protein [Streptomyces sp. VMFN-G11Ma]PTM87650.1 hypothetical protein C7821_11595 [Streptomyces sp. VMFN-G11Ma]